jgi:hypothetical protein
VNSGGTTVVNASLDKAGVIKGSVTVDVPLTPDISIDLQAYDAAGTPISGGWDFLSGRTIYQLGNLHTGTYKIQISFRDAGPNTYSNSSFYYDLKLTFPQADPVNVVTGATTSLDIDLTRLGQICGAITDYFAFHPAPHLFVVKGLDKGGQTIAETETDASGHYCLSHLAPGNYRVLFTGGVWPENCPVFCQPIQLYQEQQYPDALALGRGQLISGIDGIVVAERIFMPLVIK